MFYCYYCGLLLLYIESVYISLTRSVFTNMLTICNGIHENPRLSTNILSLPKSETTSHLVLEFASSNMFASRVCG